MATLSINQQRVIGIPRNESLGLTKVKDIASTITEFFGMIFVSHSTIHSLELNHRSKLTVHEKSEMDSYLLGIG